MTEIETTSHTVIGDAAAYEEAVAALAEGEGPVAVDAERASGFRYSQRAYLIQVFRRGAGTFLFDPPALLEHTPDLSALQAAIGDAEWVLHAASQDLPCLREVGLEPPSLFDTELASRLLGLARVGLGAVVQELLGIHLAKEHSAADWSQRPLPQSWLNYAALDVELLIDLRDALLALLDEQGKTDIAREEFADLVNRPARPARAEPWRRLSGVHTIRGARNLAVARALWEARDELARERDTAPGRLIPDSSLVAAARVMPPSKTALGNLKEFHGRTSRTELDRWWNAVERGMHAAELPSVRPASDALPPPRSWSDRNPAADRRFKAARQALTEHAEQRAIPLENLLTPEVLRRLAWDPPQPTTTESIDAALAEAGAREWQRAECVPLITQCFVEADQPVDESTPEGS